MTTDTDFLSVNTSVGTDLIPTVNLQNLGSTGIRLGTYSYRIKPCFRPCYLQRPAEHA